MLGILCRKRLRKTTATVDGEPIEQACSDLEDSDAEEEADDDFIDTDGEEHSGICPHPYSELE